MVAFAGFQMPSQSHVDATPLPQSPTRAARSSSGWMIWTALAVALAAGPALPQAGGQLIKGELSGRAEGHRVSKPVGPPLLHRNTEKPRPPPAVDSHKAKTPPHF